MRIAILLCCISGILGAGCTVARYASKGNTPNFEVIVQTDLGIPLSRLDTMLDIHLVKPDCTTDFQGRLYLDDKKDVAGLPTQQILMLEALFITTGFLGSGTTDLRSGTLFNCKTRGKISDGNYLQEQDIFRRNI